MIMSMSSPFSGSTQPTYWLAGAEHVFRGKVALSGFTFDSDPKYCLTFKLLDAKGFVYLCGRGTVTTADGTVTRLGYEDNLDTWLPLLEAKTALAREAAAQAIGFLAFTDQEKKRVVPGLIKALDDEAMEVRRNAAEALGIIGDGQASDALASHTDEAKEKDKWVREVAEEAMKKINP